MPRVFPDRSNDVRPPEDRNTTITCDACGKQMIGTYDESRMRERPPVMGWGWWCGCGATKAGGTWHPLSKDEALMQRWARMNEATT